MCSVTAKVLIESKGKNFALDFPCNSSSCISIQIVIFLFQFQSVLLFLAQFLMF